MCEIITRSPVDGMRAITHQPDPTSPCLHPHFVSSMAAAQILRRNQNPANTAVLNSNGAKNSQDVREGERRLPSEPPPPPQPLSLFPLYQKRRSVRDLTLMENDFLEGKCAVSIQNKAAFM